jgi:branched-subunit amino acid transport protein AzlD
LRMRKTSRAMTMKLWMPCSILSMLFILVLRFGEAEASPFGLDDEGEDTSGVQVFREEFRLV